MAQISHHKTEDFPNDNFEDSYPLKGGQMVRDADFLSRSFTHVAYIDLHSYHILEIVRPHVGYLHNALGYSDSFSDYMLDIYILLMDVEIASQTTCWIST